MSGVRSSSPALSAADVTPPTGDDTGGLSLTDLQVGPADSASSGAVGGSGRIGTNSRTMTGNDPGGRSRVQARVQALVQAVVQGVAGMRLPMERSEWDQLGIARDPATCSGLSQGRSRACHRPFLSMGSFDTESSSVLGRTFGVGVVMPSLRRCRATHRRGRHAP